MANELMSRRDAALYIKEEIIAGIDRHFERLRDDLKLEALDDEVEYKKQRNRVARFLGLPEV